MMILHTLRKHSSLSALAPGLAVLLLLQNLLPIQLHSHFEKNSDGITVIICTLQGEKAVQLSIPDHIDSIDDSRLSAAMLFSDLINDMSPIVGVIKSPNFVVGLNSLAAVSLPDPLAVEAIIPSSRSPPVV